MAQNSLARKIIGEALKNGGRCSRALHDNVATKKGLHNTDNVVGLVADSMGRSRVKLTASDVERSGMTRVGPSPDILHQMPRMGVETTGVAAEPPIESKSGFVMTDPNSSMWNLCKTNKEAESAAKKLTKKFIKMKDNIKQYYIDRLEENQAMFTEIEEPLRIGKIDKKERPSRFREVREEDFEPMEEAQGVSKPKKFHRFSLLNQLQNKPEMEGDGKMVAEEMVGYSDQQAKGYKKFNKLEYKKSIDREDLNDRDFEGRANRLMSKGDERMYMDQERPLLPSMWKRPQVKTDKEVKDNRGDGGFTDVSGSMSPAVHFKYPKVGLRSKGLLDSITSGDLVQGFYKKRLNESRNYSTHMKDIRLTKNGTSGFDRFKPVSLMLQREIVSNSGNRFMDSNLISAHSLSTCSKYYNSDDPNKPSGLPPKDMTCDPKEKLPKCPKLADNKPWPPCPKITLCGCDPPNPKTGCGVTELKPLISLAKRPEYICPSFSECYYRPEMTPTRRRKSECCIDKKVCDNFVGPRKPFVTASQRQEIALGQKYWSAQTQQCACYHRSTKFRPTILNRKAYSGFVQQTAGFHRTSRLASEEECERPGKAQLPCQKTVNIPGVRKKEKVQQGKGSCEKLCMPCCEPARDPPECLSIYQKGPCTKYRNPRPSFSECRKRFPFKHSMCECEVPNKPRCDQLKKQQESTC